MKVNEIMANLEAKHPGENEYLQAVREVLLALTPSAGSGALRLAERLHEVRCVAEAAFGGDRGEFHVRRGQETLRLH